jgi:2-amino-4-hydroxy-6-hydroxymethyldihydropteridine diphosphokinase
MLCVSQNQCPLKWKLTVEKIMNYVIVSIGSNIDPEENIGRAIEILSLEVSVIQITEFIKTAPIGLADQADFMNGAVKIRTNMEMENFRLYLKKLEDRLGRDRSQPKYGPRCIDLDLLIWNREIVDEDYYTRDFLRNFAAELGFS